MGNFCRVLATSEEGGVFFPVTIHHTIEEVRSKCDAYSNGSQVDAAIDKKTNIWNGSQKRILLGDKYFAIYFGDGTIWDCEVGTRRSKSREALDRMLNEYNVRMDHDRSRDKGD